MVEGLKPPARWPRSYWDEGDILFFFEADEDGVVLRQVELKGLSRKPIAAGSLAELPQIVGSAPVVEYEQRWGGIADQPIPEWDEDFPHYEITADEFEAVWRRARRGMSLLQVHSPTLAQPEVRTPDPARLTDTGKP